MTDVKQPLQDQKASEQEDQAAAELDSVNEKEAQRAEAKAVMPRTVLHNAYRGRK